MDEEVLYTAALAGSLVLSEHGEWLHEGQPIVHQRVREFLFKHVEWHAEKRNYRIRFGKGAATFTCRDTAYFVTGLEVSLDHVAVTLSDLSIEELDLSSLRSGCENQIYCTVKGAHTARFTRSAHQSLLTFALDEDTLDFGGRRAKVEPWHP